MKLIPFFFLLLVFLFPVEPAFAKNPPKFWIRNLEAQRFSSKKQKTPFVISFFFVHCVPCIKEIPELHKFMSTNYPDVPLLFIDPIKEDSKKDILNFAEKLHVPHSYFYKDSFGSIPKNSSKAQCLFLLLLVSAKTNTSSVLTESMKIF